jgi:hypothetical protein
VPVEDPVPAAGRHDRPKLNLHEADEGHRRVLAAITFLKAR